MRIVVPISKALFEKMKSNKNHIDDFYYYDISPVAKAVSRGKPLTNKDIIKELEKIRQESARLTESKIMATGTRADGRMDIIEIIDKRISELKGDKDESE